jgi:ribonuclease T2
MSKALQRAAIAASFTFLFVIVALAQGAPRTQDARQNAPGQFDFYVLALSWSPSYCEAAAERAPKRPPDRQCAGRPFSFVVHGLWPQYERGFPSYCQVPAPRMDRGTMTSMLDLMPSPKLVFHEWDRHGTCSGLTVRAYFETIRKARAVVKIPADYLDLAKPITVRPDEVVDAFVKANPGLPREGIAVACGSKRLEEVRVCLGKDLSFRACAETVQRSCRRGTIAMPAVRGG